MTLDSNPDNVQAGYKTMNEDGSSTWCGMAFGALPALKVGDHYGAHDGEEDWVGRGRLSKFRTSEPNFQSEP